MKRKIIEIDESKCVGCGLCANACQEGAIGIMDGKAKLLREDYCDGLGNCLPVCPTDAISFIERDAQEYDEQAARIHQQNEQGAQGTHEHSSTAAADHHEEHEEQCGCPGSAPRSIGRASVSESAPACGTAGEGRTASELRNWPVQIKLAPINASFYDNANLLVAADCAAYARAGFHNEYMRGKVTLIGCPKLDDADYSVKLCEIISNNNIKSLTIARMEVPCCGGIEQAAVTALKNSGKFIPWQVVTLGTDGGIIEN